MTGKPKKISRLRRAIFPAVIVFLYKNASKIPKIFCLRRAYCYRNPFSNVSKVFFAPAAGHHSVFVFYACLQGASTQAYNFDFLSAPAAGPNHNVFSFMLVYRTHLGKHKTLNVSREKMHFRDIPGEIYI